MLNPSFFKDLARHGETSALVFPNGRVITYAELADRVEQQASCLGTGKRLVAIEACLSEHTVIAYLAALKRGHAAALLSPNDPGTARRFGHDFQPDCQYRLVEDRWRLEIAHDMPRGDLHPDLTLLLSTSGSTGLSRYVRLSAGNLISNANAIAIYLRLDPSDRGTLILPLHYSYGLSVLNSHLAIGASLFLPEKSILEPGFVEGLRQAGCTNFSGIPYSYDLLEQVGLRGEALPDLRFMTVAGGRLAPDLVERYRTYLTCSGKQFFVMYGQTEATARIAFVPPKQLADNTDKIGVAIPGGELSLVDENGQTIKAEDTPGELVYRGPNVMMGYASSRTDLGRRAELDRLDTGDLAVRDQNGLYRIVGRLRRMSKIAGLRIGHDALEHALAKQGIKAAVIGDDKAILAVYISAHSDNEVRQILIEASGLPSFHIRAKAAQALPRLASGKVDYEQLKPGLADHPSPAIDGIQDLFQEAFFPHVIGPNDSFVSLGGDSLRYVQLSIGLERVLGSLPEGWENKPIAQLQELRRGTEKTQVFGTDLIIRALEAVRDSG